MPLLERWLLHRLRELDGIVRKGYETYQFRGALSAIVEFCNVDLSAFYLDVRKDALYCDAARLRCAAALAARRWTKCSRVSRRGLRRFMPFTMEEAWLTRFPEQVSVHLRQFPETPDGMGGSISRRCGDGASAQARAVVTGALEVARREKLIGAALEASPRVFIADPVLLGPAKTNDLAELCITSGVKIEAGPGPADAFHLAEIPGIWVVPEKAEGRKCARSWRILPKSAMIRVTLT